MHIVRFLGSYLFVIIIRTLTHLFYHEMVPKCMWTFLEVVSWLLRPVAAAFVFSVDRYC